MPKEPIIQDKIHLLMEETGCDHGQAELAMTLAGYDLEKAIRTIGTLLRNIVVVRGKFLLPERNLYGLLILVADIKRGSFLRGRAVVSYNPSLYETPLEVDWYDFERSLYAFRLWEGTLQQVTQELERALLERLERTEGENFYEVLRDGPDVKLKDRLETILAGYFSGSRPTLAISREELNLDQFKRFKPQEEASSMTGHDRPLESFSSESLVLYVDLQQAADGVPAKNVKAGDSVHVLITDQRDIAQYLSKLLGGRQGEGLKPLVAPVEETRNKGGMVFFQIRLSTGILGVAEVSENSLLSVQKLTSASWWKRWLPEF